METVRVTAPNREFTGDGPAGTKFKDGVAEVDRDNAAAIAYFRGAGYGIDGDPDAHPLTGDELAEARRRGIDVDQATGADPARVRQELRRQPDSREVGGTRQVGEPLRDAAVDPRPGDFMVPTNAGRADPHGPDVVSPSVHAAPPAPVTPGPVSPNPAVQEQRETELADEVLVQNRDVGDATAESGAQARGERPSDGDAAGFEVGSMPAGNASKARWVKYATEQAPEGQRLSREEADGLSRDDLAARYKGDQS